MVVGQSPFSTRLQAFMVQDHGEIGVQDVGLSLGLRSKANSRQGHPSRWAHPPPPQVLRQRGGWCVPLPRGTGGAIALGV